MVLDSDDTNILVEDRDENALKLKAESVMKQLEVSFLNNEFILNIQNLCGLFVLVNVDTPVNHTSHTIIMVSPIAQKWNF